jgi:hypothetical protein
MAIYGPFVLHGNPVSLAPVTDPASLNVASLDHPGDLGKVFEQNGALYRIVLHAKGTGSVATVAGGSAYWKAYDPASGTFTVTMDETDSLYGVNGVAGGYLGVVTDGNYCCIQVGGRQTGVSVAAATGIGDQLSGSTTDGQLAKTTAGTAAVNQIVAIAETAVSSGTSTVKWNAGALIY